MCTVSTDICASHCSVSGLSTTRWRTVVRFDARVGVSMVVTHGGASLPTFWWNHDGASMPWFQCSSASGRSRSVTIIASATAA